MPEQQPVISTGSSETTERVIRTGAQALSPALVIEGLRVFHVWEPEPAQLTWLLTSSTVAAALAQNWWERRKGRKLLGRTPTKETR